MSKASGFHHPETRFATRQSLANIPSVAVDIFETQIKERFSTIRFSAPRQDMRAINALFDRKKYPYFELLAIYVT